MKLYISIDADEKCEDIREKFDITSTIEDSDEVLVLPGGLGSFYDMFRAIKLGKDTIVYNKDMYYTSVIKNMYEAHLKGNIDEVPSFYIDIESDYNEILKKLEEKENGKVNNGENSKLL